MTALAGTAAAADRVVLQLRWDHQFQFAGYYAAQWRGYYTEVGLDVEIRGAVTPERRILRAVEEVAERRADFGVGAADILLAREAGHELLVVASVFQQSPVGVISRRASEVSAPADLAPLRITRRRGDLTDLEFAAMLRAEGLDPDALEVVDHSRYPGRTHFELMSTGIIDGYTAYVGAETWKADRAGEDISIMRPASYGIDFYGDSLFTRNDVVTARPGLVERFRSASLRGWRYALEHPFEIADRITEEMPIVFPIRDHKEFNRFLTKEVSRLTLHPVVALGHTNPDRWRRIHGTLAEVGLVRGEFEPSKVIFDPETREKERVEQLQRTSMAVSAALGCLFTVAAGWAWALRRAVRRATGALRESEERLRSILDHACSVIFLKDRNSRYILVNRLYERLHGVTSDEIAGKTDYEVFAPDIAEPLRDNDRRVIAEGKALELEEEVPAGDELRTFLSVKFPIFDRAGNVSGVCGIATDISDRKRAEQELSRHRDHLEELVVERTAALESAHEALVEKERLAVLGQLIATIGHELRNPLATIHTTIQGLRSRLGERGADVERLMQRADRGVERCGHIIGELLDFTRTRELELERLDIDTLLAAVLADVDVPSHVTLVQELHAGAACMVDRDRLERAVLNVLQNGWQATPEEGGPRPLTLRTHRCGERVEIRITDSGDGMAPDVLERAFQPLFTTKSVGVGLGLPLVRSIMERHEGGIEIESVAGGGTTMVLWLPIAGSEVAVESEGT